MTILVYDLEFILHLKFNLEALRTDKNKKAWVLTTLPHQAFFVSILGQNTLYQWIYMSPETSGRCIVVDLFWDEYNDFGKSDHADHGLSIDNEQDGCLGGKIVN